MSTFTVKLTLRWQNGWRWGQKRLYYRRMVLGTVTRYKQGHTRGSYLYRASGLAAKDTDHKSVGDAMRAVVESFQ